MDPLLKDLDKLSKRQASLKASTLVAFDGIISALSSSDFRAQESVVISSLTQMEEQTRQSLARCGADQKEYQNTMAKYGKSVEKAFPNTPWKLIRPDAFEKKQEQLVKLLSRHMIRQGNERIVESLVQESGAQLDAKSYRQFSEVSLLLSAFAKREFSACHRWIEQHRAALEAKHSILEYSLHRLEFLDLLSAGKRTEAVEFVRRAFGRHSNRHAPDIRRLMAALVFSDRLSSSPYADLLETDSTPTCYRLLQEEACTLLGVPAESSLEVCVNIGACAVPKLYKAWTVMHVAKKDPDFFTSLTELPIEILLPSRHYYHSLLVCPVLKEQTSLSNAPMRLLCGHVLSMESIKRLAKGTRPTSSGKFKCPYCPSEQTVTDTIRVFL